LKLHYDNPLSNIGLIFNLKALLGSGGGGGERKDNGADAAVAEGAPSGAGEEAAAGDEGGGVESGARAGVGVGVGVKGAGAGTRGAGARAGVNKVTCLECLHVYHTMCWEGWCAHSASCPECKRTVNLV